MSASAPPRRSSPAHAAACYGPYERPGVRAARAQESARTRRSLHMRGTEACTHARLYDEPAASADGCRASYLHGPGWPRRRSASTCHKFCQSCPLRLTDGDRRRIPPRLRDLACSARSPTLHPDRRHSAPQRLRPATRTRLGYAVDSLPTFGPLPARYCMAARPPASDDIINCERSRAR